MKAFVRMDCLQDRLTKRFQIGLRSKHMSNAKHYEWIFRRKVVKKIFIVRFWRIKPSESWFVRIGLAPWKLNTSKAKIESIEKKRKLFSKEIFMLYRYNENIPEKKLFFKKRWVFVAKATKPNFPLIAWSSHICKQICCRIMQSIKGKFYQTGQARKSIRWMPWH